MMRMFRLASCRHTAFPAEQDHLQGPAKSNLDTKEQDRLQMEALDKVICHPLQDACPQTHTSALVW